MKYCENCGAQLEDDAVFCEECGHKVEKVSQEKIVDSEKHKETKTDIIDKKSELSKKDVNDAGVTKDNLVHKTDTKSKKLIPVLCGVVGLLLVIMIIIVLITNRKTNDDKKEVNESITYVNEEVTEQNITEKETAAKTEVESQTQFIENTINNKNDDISSLANKKYISKGKNKIYFKDGDETSTKYSIYFDVDEGVYAIMDISGVLNKDGYIVTKTSSETIFMLNEYTNSYSFAGSVQSININIDTNNIKNGKLVSQISFVYNGKQINIDNVEYDIQ